MGSGTDYERSKASATQKRQSAAAIEDLDTSVRHYEQAAAARGVDYLTFRRLAEAHQLSTTVATQLRAHLIATRPDHHVPPIWATRPRLQEQAD